MYTIHEKKQLIGHLADAQVEVFSQAGEARFLDARTLGLPDGRRLQAEKFILCAGGRARRLDFAGAELALTHGDVWALRALPKSVIIVGGAATGCQLAAIFEAFGAQASILERNHRILGVHMAATGMAAGMWVEQLAELQIAYPTFTAVIGLAARKIIRQLGVVPLTPEWRSLEKRQPHKSLRAEWELKNSSTQS